MKASLVGIVGGIAGASGVVMLLWITSLPQVLHWILNHDELAAWLQAIFSVIAIGVTGWALIRQERRQEVIGRIDRYTARGDQLESLTAISSRLEALIAEVRFNNVYVIDGYDDDDWAAVEKALSRVPAHEARDPEIAAAVMTLAIESARIRRNLQAYVLAENASGPTSPGWRMFNEQFQPEIIGCMGEAICAHLLLCSRLTQVLRKRDDAETKLAAI